MDNLNNTKTNKSLQKGSRRGDDPSMSSEHSSHLSRATPMRVAAARSDTDSEFRVAGRELGGAALQMQQPGKAGQMEEDEPLNHLRQHPQHHVHVGPNKPIFSSMGGSRNATSMTFDFGEESRNRSSRNNGPKEFVYREDDFQPLDTHTMDHVKKMDDNDEGRSIQSKRESRGRPKYDDSAMQAHSVSASATSKTAAPAHQRHTTVKSSNALGGDSSSVMGPESLFLGEPMAQRTALMRTPLEQSEYEENEAEAKHQHQDRRLGHRRQQRVEGLDSDVADSKEAHHLDDSQSPAQLGGHQMTSQGVQSTRAHMNDDAYSKVSSYAEASKKADNKSSTSHLHEHAFGNTGAHFRHKAIQVDRDRVETSSPELNLGALFPEEPNESGRRIVGHSQRQTQLDNSHGHHAHAMPAQREGKMQRGYEDPLDQRDHHRHQGQQEHRAAGISKGSMPIHQHHTAVQASSVHSREASPEMNLESLFLDEEISSSGRRQQSSQAARSTHTQREDRIQADSVGQHAHAVPARREAPMQRGIEDPSGNHNHHRHQGQNNGREHRAGVSQGSMPVQQHHAAVRSSNLHGREVSPEMNLGSLFAEEQVRETGIRKAATSAGDQVSEGGSSHGGHHQLQGHTPHKEGEHRSRNEGNDPTDHFDHHRHDNRGIDLDDSYMHPQQQGNIRGADRSGISDYPRGEDGFHGHVFHASQMERGHEQELQTGLLSHSHGSTAEHREPMTLGSHSRPMSLAHSHQIPDQVSAQHVPLPTAPQKKKTWFGVEIPVKSKQKAASRGPGLLSLGFGFKEMKKTALADASSGRGSGPSTAVSSKSALAPSLAAPPQIQTTASHQQAMRAAHSLAQKADSMATPHLSSQPTATTGQPHEERIHSLAASIKNADEPRAVNVASYPSTSGTHAQSTSATVPMEGQTPATRSVQRDQGALFETKQESGPQCSAPRRLSVVDTIRSAFGGHVSATSDMPDLGLDSLFAEQPMTKSHSTTSADSVPSVRHEPSAAERALGAALGGIGTLVVAAMQMPTRVAHALQMDNVFEDQHQPGTLSAHDRLATERHAHGHGNSEAVMLKRPSTDLSLYPEEESSYPRGGDSVLHENPDHPKTVMDVKEVSYLHRPAPAAAAVAEASASATSVNPKHQQGPQHHRFHGTSSPMRLPHSGQTHKHTHGSAMSADSTGPHHLSASLFKRPAGPSFLKHMKEQRSHWDHPADARDEMTGYLAHPGRSTVAAVSTTIPISLTGAVRPTATTAATSTASQSKSATSSSQTKASFLSGMIASSASSAAPTTQSRPHHSISAALFQPKAKLDLSLFPEENPDYSRSDATTRHENPAHPKNVMDVIEITMLAVKASGVRDGLKVEHIPSRATPSKAHAPVQRSAAAQSSSEVPAAAVSVPGHKKSHSYNHSKAVGLKKPLPDLMLYPEEDASYFHGDDLNVGENPASPKNVMDIVELPLRAAAKSRDDDVPRTDHVPSLATGLNQYQSHHSLSATFFKPSSSHNKTLDLSLYPEEDPAYFRGDLYSPSHENPAHPKNVMGVLELPLDKAQQHDHHDLHPTMVESAVAAIALGAESVRAMPVEGVTHPPHVDSIRSNKDKDLSKSQDRRPTLSTAAPVHDHTSTHVYPEAVNKTLSPAVLLKDDDDKETFVHRGDSYYGQHGAQLREHIPKSAHSLPLAASKSNFPLETRHRGDAYYGLETVVANAVLKDDDNRETFLHRGDSYYGQQGAQLREHLPKAVFSSPSVTSTSNFPLETRHRGDAYYGSHTTDAEVIETQHQQQQQPQNRSSTLTTAGSLAAPIALAVSDATTKTQHELGEHPRRDMSTDPEPIVNPSLQSRGSTVTTESTPGHKINRWDGVSVIPPGSADQVTSTAALAAATTTNMMNNHDPTSVPVHIAAAAVMPSASDTTSQTTTMATNTNSAAIQAPAGYDGVMPELREGETVVWVKKVQTVEEFYNSGEEDDMMLGELGHRSPKQHHAVDGSRQRTGPAQ